MVAPRRLPAEQPAGRPVELLHDHLGHPFRADRRRRGRVHARGVDGVVVDRGVDAAGRHVDDAQPATVDVLDHQLPGERPHAPLADDVRRHLRDRDVAQQRADDHEHPAVLVAHDGHDVASQVGGAGQVRCQHPVEHLGRDLLDPSVGDLPGAVGDAVEPVVLGQHPFHEQGHLGVVGDVGRHHLRRGGPGLAALAGDLVELRLGARDEHEVVAVAARAAGRPPARSRWTHPVTSTTDPGPMPAAWSTPPFIGPPRPSRRSGPSARG